MSNKATICVDSYIYDNVIKTIDQSKFMNLHMGASERPKLFDFALAIGLKDKRSKINHLTSLWRWAQIEDHQLSIYDSIWYVQENNSSKLEGVMSGADVINVAEEYANTGFLKLEQMINDGKNAETFALELIAEMDNIDIENNNNNNNNNND